ncbi:MAG TPA: helix-turn-helix domain-containing protein [Stackebrandtia sp.]|uniref:GlxA family transcriptional regulator n=1 Tax=Stackebrandtia sp. TaxID=2023065 RepID=UPI002D65FBFB|nr:helix-turn-helix domain-containing protein [Stackebrandtia sp.]HZE38397.1 helix-turn-helix domain-containing protein [Stackebrandtia sp.]
MSVSRHRVVMLVMDGVIPFELGIPPRIFGAARDADGRRLYEVSTCALTPGMVRTTEDFTIHVPAGPEALGRADTVVIPASYEIDAMFVHGVLPGDVAAALAHIRPGTRIASICTGSFVLAAAGLLDGRPATTHWMHTEQLRRLYPRVKVDPDVLFVDDGDVLTSAGVASGIDLCLHMVRKDFGAAVANVVARRSVVPPQREGGQAQFIRHPVAVEPGAATAGARAWALARLGAAVSLERWAAEASMSVRTFSRRFRAEVGLTPGQWLLRQRLDAARTMLETSRVAVDRVAVECGFGTAASMRRHMRAVLGVSPSSYRKTFAGET